MIKGFRQSNSSLRNTSDSPRSFKVSAKGFSFKKPSLTFHKSGSHTPRCSHDRPATAPNPTPSAPSRATTPTPDFRHGDDVICISREDSFDSSSVYEISPDGDEFQTPSNSPYPSSYYCSSSSTSSSSSSCLLPPEIDDQLLDPVDEIVEEFDPRRGSQLSMVSSWVDHHLEDLNLTYGEDGVYEIEIVRTADGFPSRRDSFILPPGETFQSFQRKRNLPVVPTKQFSRMSRPLPSTPPRYTLQPKPFRPLPPPPSPSW